MKFLTALLTLATSVSFAAPKTETFKTHASVSLNLHCEIGLMGSQLSINERITTVLPKPYIITGLNNAIEANHKAFSAPGCDLAALDQLSLDSNQHFGYLMGVPMTIVKDTSASRRAGNGTCYARFTETVTLDLGRNIVLTSQAIKILPMNDCPAL